MQPQIIQPYIYVDSEAKDRGGEIWLVISLITVISETLDKVSVSTTLAQSRLVSVSTSSKFLGLEESRYRKL
jgi:hypothetical protein